MRAVTMSRPRSYDVAMRRLVLLLATAALVGCADSGLAPVATDQVRARFPPGGVVDVIEVDAVDRLPLRKAELIAPDGRAIPASYLNVNPSPGVTFDPEFASGPGYGFGSGNIGPGLTLGGAQQRVAVLAMVSTASIPLPDPVEYRRDWRGYRIRLDFGDLPGEVKTREITAPEPPRGG
jgi:hypothetical protein